MLEKLKDRLKDVSTGKLLFNVIFMMVGALLMGYILRVLLANIGTILEGQPFAWHPEYLAKIGTFVIGMVFMILARAVFWAGTSRSGSVSDTTKGFLGGKDNHAVADSPLENSRFLTDKERDKYFPPFDYTDAQGVKKDGVPVRAVLNKKGHDKVYAA